jgi:hypothetical protein
MKTKILGALLALHLEVPGRKSPAKPLQYLIALKEDLANCRRPVTVSGRVVCDRVIWKLFQNLRIQHFSAVFTLFRDMSRTRIPLPDAVFFEPKYLPDTLIAKHVTALCHF